MRAEPTIVTFSVAVVALVLATNIVAPTAAYSLSTGRPALDPGVADGSGGGSAGFRCDLCALPPEVLASTSLTSVHGNPLRYIDPTGEMSEEQKRRILAVGGRIGQGPTGPNLRQAIGHAISNKREAIAPGGGLWAGPPSVAQEIAQGHTAASHWIRAQGASASDSIGGAVHGPAVGASLAAVGQFGTNITFSIPSWFAGLDFSQAGDDSKSTIVDDLGRQYSVAANAEAPYLARVEAACGLAEFGFGTALTVLGGVKGMTPKPVPQPVGLMGRMNRLLAPERPSTTQTLRGILGAEAADLWAGMAKAEVDAGPQMNAIISLRGVRPADILANYRDARAIRRVVLETEDAFLGEIARLRDSGLSARSIGTRAGRIAANRGLEVAEELGIPLRAEMRLTIPRYLRARTEVPGEFAAYRLGDLVFPFSRQRLVLELTLEDAGDLFKMSLRKQGQLADYYLAGSEVLLITP